MAKNFQSDIRQVALADWRAKDRRPIGIIDLRPADFSTRWHIQFEIASDDLDDMAVAVVQIPTRAKYLLIRYVHDPGPGITVYRPASAARRADLSKLLHTLGLGAKDVAWTANRLGATPSRTRKAKRPAIPKRAGVRQLAIRAS